MSLHGRRSASAVERAAAARPKRFSSMPYIPYRGTPRTPEEWAALAKIASGETDVGKHALRELFLLGLVDRQLCRVCLSEHGRDVLGSAVILRTVNA